MRGILLACMFAGALGASLARADKIVTIDDGGGACPLAEEIALGLCHAELRACEAAPKPTCPQPLVEHCRVAKDVRWRRPVLKCRSVFSLPR